VNDHKLCEYEITCERPGYWRVRRHDGLVEGIFIDHEGARRFVRRQGMALNGALDDCASVDCASVDCASVAGRTG
jgi:hypothetical protein